MSDEKKKNLAQIAQYRKELKHKEKKEVLKKVYDPTFDKEDAEATSDWEELSRIAQFKFPEGAKHLDLTPNQALAAVAHCLGWTQAKIARAGKLRPSTVSRWLKRDDVKAFIDEFNLKNTPDADRSQALSGLAYASIQFMSELLSDDDPEKDRLKLQAAQTVLKMTEGELHKHEGTAFKDMLKVVKEFGGSVELSEEEEEEIFTSH